MNKDLQAFDIQTANIRRIDALPKGIPKDAWHKCRSENLWRTAKVVVRDGDAYIVLTAYSTMKLPKIIFEIPSFRFRSGLAVENDIERFATGCADAHPFGRNFSDCLHWLCNTHGMRWGYVLGWSESCLI